MTILTATFCVYCQTEYGSPVKLQRHVLRQHPHTYASAAILEAREAAKT